MLFSSPPGGPQASEVVQPCVAQHFEPSAAHMAEFGKAWSLTCLQRLSRWVQKLWRRGDWGVSFKINCVVWVAVSMSNAAG